MSPEEANDGTGMAPLSTIVVGKDLSNVVCVDVMLCFHN